MNGFSTGGPTGTTTAVVRTRARGLAIFLSVPQTGNRIGHQDLGSKGAARDPSDEPHHSVRKAVIASVPTSLRHHLPQLLEEVLDLYISDSTVSTQSLDGSVAPTPQAPETPRYTSRPSWMPLHREKRSVTRDSARSVLILARPLPLLRGG